MSSSKRPEDSGTAKRPERADWEKMGIPMGNKAGPASSVETTEDHCETDERKQVLAEKEEVPKKPEKDYRTEMKEKREEQWGNVPHTENEPSSAEDGSNASQEMIKCRLKQKVPKDTSAGGDSNTPRKPIKASLKQKDPDDGREMMKISATIKQKQKPENSE